jgi:hypothetical protein
MSPAQHHTLGNSPHAGTVRRITDCPYCCCCGAAVPLQSQYVIQQRNVTHLEAHATGVKEEEIRPVIAFLRRHLGLASEQELTEPAAAEAGAARGEPKEGLDPDTAEDLAEVQFPST